jgi:hypothetical protein
MDKEEALKVEGRGVRRFAMIDDSFDGCCGLV